MTAGRRRQRTNNATGMRSLALKGNEMESRPWETRRSRSSRLTVKALLSRLPTTNANPGSRSTRSPNTPSMKRGRGQTDREMGNLSMAEIVESSVIASTLPHIQSTSMIWSVFWSILPSLPVDDGHCILPMTSFPRPPNAAATIWCCGQPR